jgi:hypothetical protein
VSRFVALDIDETERGEPFVIGIRRSFPKARVVTFTPGGAWRRLYSARSTS